MNKSMKWIMDSLARHLKENNCDLPYIVSDTESDDKISLRTDSRNTSWHILQYLFSIQIRHIWVAQDFSSNVNQLPIPICISFDIKHDKKDKDEYTFRVF